MDTAVIRFFLILALLVTPTVAMADPVSMAIASVVSSMVSTGTTLAGLTFTAFGASLSGVGAFIAHVFVRAALGYALSALSRPPKGAPGGYTVNALGAAQPTAFIYGETRVGGVVFYQETTGNKNKILHTCIALAAHEIEDVVTVYFNDEELTLDVDGNVTSPSKWDGYATVRAHLGADDQEAEELLVAESEKWTSEHRVRGVAYLYVRLRFHKDKWPNGVPTVTAIVKGKKVYDPRIDTTRYSNNTALCLRDYLINEARIATAAEIDDVSFSAAANVCDETIDLAEGGTEKRYACNGTSTTDVSIADNITAIMSSMGGLLWYSQGTWMTKAAAYSTPTVTLDEDDLRSALQVVTRHSRRDSFNRVEGLFRGPDSDWQPTNFPAISSEEFLAVDGGLENTKELTLSFTSSVSTAQRVAKIALYRNREQLRVSGTWGMGALGISVGDVVRITNSFYGFSAKEFEVQDWRLGYDVEQGLVVSMTMQEISAAVFEWDAEEQAFETNNTTLLSAFDVPEIGMALSSQLRVAMQQLLNVLILNVTSSDPDRVDRVEFEYRKEGETDWTTGGFGQLGLFEIAGLEDANYDVRVRAVNTFGVNGDWTTYYGFQVSGLSAPPADVENFAAQVNGDVITLTWDPVADLDLSHYKIRYTPELTGATWADSTVVVERVPRPATSVVVSAREGTYMIRAVDKTGSQSTNVASVAIIAGAVVGFGTVLTQDEDPTFSGTKTGTVVTSNELRLGSATEWDSLSGNVDSLTGLFDDLGIAVSGGGGEYEFSTYIDTGSVTLSRVEVQATMYRLDTASGLFDGLGGNIDTLAGLWDDLTGGTDTDDVNVKAYVATTDDDPAGTPTWSSWYPLLKGDFYNRAFKFKIKLTSDTVGITPSVTDLFARVSH